MPASHMTAGPHDSLLLSYCRQMRHATASMTPLTDAALTSLPGPAIGVPMRDPFALHPSGGSGVAYDHATARRRQPHTHPRGCSVRTGIRQHLAVPREIGLPADVTH